MDKKSQNFFQNEPNKKILIPLDARVDLKSFKRKWSQLSKQQVRCIALTYDAADQLERAGIPHEFRERASDLNLLRKVRPFSISTTRTWYKHHALKKYIYDQEINLGRLIAWELMYVMNVLMDRWLNVRELVAQWNPDEILNVYKLSPIQHSRIQHDESVVNQITDMLLDEFPNLRIENAGISFSGVGGKARALIGLVKNWFRFFVSQTLMPVLVRLHNLQIKMTKDVPSSIPHIVFYSGWWHFFSTIKLLSTEKTARITLMQGCFGLDILKKIWSLRLYLDELSFSGVPASDRRLWNVTKDIMQKQVFPEQFTFEGINLWPLLRARFDYFWSTQVGELSHCIAVIKKHLLSLKAQVLAVENDTVPLERTVVTTANALGIKTIVLQHGETSGGETGKDPMKFSDHAFIPLTAAQIAVFGCISKDFFLAKGIAPSRVVMTGYPRFDRYFLPARYQSRDLFFKRLGIPTNKKIILYANRPDYKNIYTVEYSMRFQDTEKLIRAIIEAVDRIPEAHLILKMKANEPQDPIAILDRHFGIYLRKNVSVLYQADVPTLLNHVDLIVGSWSTMLTEALIFKKPVLVINLTGRPDPMANTEMRAAIGVYQEKDIYPTIERMLNDESFRNQNAREREEYVHNYIISHKGDGAQRFKDHLLTMSTCQKLEPIPARSEDLINFSRTMNNLEAK